MSILIGITLFACEMLINFLPSPRHNGGVASFLGQAQRHYSISQQATFKYKCYFMTLWLVCLLTNSQMAVEPLTLAWLVGCVHRDRMFHMEECTEGSSMYSRLPHSCTTHGRVDAFKIHSTLHCILK